VSKSIKDAAPTITHTHTHARARARAQTGDHFSIYIFKYCGIIVYSLY